MSGINYDCPNCGGRMPIAVRSHAAWGYKVGEKNVCSYTCMREMERKPQRLERDKVMQDIKREEYVRRWQREKMREKRKAQA